GVHRGTRFLRGELTRGIADDLPRGLVVEPARSYAPQLGVGSAHRVVQGRRTVELQAVLEVVLSGHVAIVAAAPPRQHPVLEQGGLLAVVAEVGHTGDLGAIGTDTVRMVELRVAEVAAGTRVLPRDAARTRREVVAIGVRREERGAVRVTEHAGIRIPGAITRIGFRILVRTIHAPHRRAVGLLHVVEDVPVFAGL